MRYLRTNTATRVTVGPFYDVTDGVTPELLLTEATADCHLTLIVDTAGVPTLVVDADVTDSGGDNDMFHISGDDAGLYDLELTDAQLNYLGRAYLSIVDSSVHAPVFHEFSIVNTTWYDGMFT